MSVGYEQQAEYGIYCENAVKLRCTDGEIVGVGRDAVGFCMMKSYALFADNLHFRGYESQSMGVMMRTSDCRMAVDNRGHNFYSRIHVWMAVKRVKGSIFFHCKGDPAYTSHNSGCSTTPSCGKSLTMTSLLNCSILLPKRWLSNPN